jgi:hypothetical protein
VTVEDLVRWLGEQLDEDERMARAATLGPWVQSGIGDYGWTVDFGRPGAGVETADTEQGLADADFIAAHNPARVLRDIDAKRQVLTGYTKAVEAAEELGALRERLKASGQDVFMTEMERASAIHKRDVLYGVLQILALPYTDRPGYREEWRP